jgi:hypothetical protein
MHRDDIRVSAYCYDLFKTIEKAKELFINFTDWEEDGDIYITGLPTDDGGGFPYYLVIIKQENNGTTFLYSPVELTHLKEHLVKRL